MKRLNLLVAVCLIIMLLLSCAEETLITPADEEPFDRDPVGCWELVSSNSLFEGNLFVMVDGNATEYAVRGFEMRTYNHDFKELQYTLAENELYFWDRIYKRNNDIPMESPCKYFPDEGLIKIFQVNDVFVFCLRVGYDYENAWFFERRSIWSPEYGLEQDTILYKVRSDKIDVSWIGYEKWFFEFWRIEYALDPWPPYPPRSYRIQSIGDSTIIIGDISDIDVIAYNYGDWYDYPTLLERLDMPPVIAYFAPGLGAVIYLSGLHNWLGEPSIRDKAEIVSFVNPKRSIAADRARRDYRHVQRYK